MAELPVYQISAEVGANQTSADIYQIYISYNEKNNIMAAMRMPCHARPDYSRVISL